MNFAAWLVASCRIFVVGNQPAGWGINQQVGCIAYFSENVGSPINRHQWIATYGPFCRIPKHQVAEVRSSCVLDFEG